MATRSELAAWAGSDLERKRAIAARSRRTPPELLVILLRDEATRVASYARANASLPEPTLEALVEDLIANRRMDLWLMYNPSLTSDMLQRIYDSGLHRPLVIRHKNCSEEVLRSAALSNSVEYRKIAAKHPNLPSDCWGIVLADEKPAVRSAAVRNKAIPVDRLAPLVNDRNLSILRAVASRATGETKSAALANLERRSRAKETKWVLAQHSDNPEVLERLAVDSNRWVRRKAAENSHATDEVKVAAALLG